MYNEENNQGMGNNERNEQDDQYRYVRDEIRQDRFDEEQDAQQTQSRSYYTPYDEPEHKMNRKERRKMKKEKKTSGGFGMKVVKCAALALVFGTVAGGTMVGINYAGNSLIGSNTRATQAADQSDTASTQVNKVQATSTSASTTTLDVSDVVSETMPSIVSINCVEQVTQRSFFGQSQTYDAESAGSGIIVKETKSKLYIVTNNHVIDGADSVTVTFIDDSTVAAEVKGTDSASDLAVLEISLDDLDSDTLSQIKVAAMGDSDEVLVGQTAIAIGNALGYGQSVTTGVISALNREVTVENVTNELLQTDAAINPGNSGGALLNAKGEVIGINSAKYSDTDVEGMGYAIPINTAAPIIEQLIDKEIVSEDKAGYLGIKGVDVSDSVASTYDLPSGVYVGYVAEGAAADTAGIVKGDIITGFEGRTITSMEDLQNQLQYYAAGTTVTVTIERANNGEYVEQEISVTLGEKVGTTTESSDEDSSEDSGNSQQNGGSSDDQEDSYSDFFNYYGSDDNSSNGFFQIP